MNFLEVDCKITKFDPPLRRYIANPVVIVVDTKFDEFLENPTTGHRTRTGRFDSDSPPLLISFNLHSSRPWAIREVLRNRLASHSYLWEDLASDISETANDLGFGRNEFGLSISVTIIHENVVVRPDPPVDEALSLKAELLRMVLLGKIGGEESKRLKMETEPCSICLDNLSGSKQVHGVPTRMSCSHVFHGRCLLEWLERKNTCPLCRTVLYDR